MSEGELRAVCSLALKPHSHPHGFAYLIQTREGSAMSAGDLRAACSLTLKPRLRPHGFACRIQTREGSL